MCRRKQVGNVPREQQLLQQYMHWMLHCITKLRVAWPHPSARFQLVRLWAAGVGRPSGTCTSSRQVPTPLSQAQRWGQAGFDLAASTHLCTSCWMGSGGVASGGKEGKSGLRTMAPVPATADHGVWLDRSCLHVLGGGQVHM